jgi:UDP-glucose 4-epimerase
MNILLTGGTGYIGSHTAVVLVEAGHSVVLFDNLSNSQRDVVERLEKITNKPIPFIEGDVRDTELISLVICEHKIGAVIHFAGLKAVGESVEKPLDYFDNNVGGTYSLLRAMLKNNVKMIVFSSSATVYGEPRYLPIDELHSTSTTNPYGRTKLHIEEVLQELSKSDPDWRVVCLRYFNPVGAHDSGLIGEDPKDTPNNLMPYMANVAAGYLPSVHVLGNDYLTPDGTGVRDYIHVVDLAQGHLAALELLNKRSGWDAINLGTGQGSSVFDMIKEFSLITGKNIPYEVRSRRPGDVASCYASVQKAADLMGWRAEKSLQDMCESAWRWQCLK